MLVDLEEDARMTKGGGDAVPGTVAGDSAGMDADDLGRCLHEGAVSIASGCGQYGARRRAEALLYQADPGRSYHFGR